MTRMSCVTVMIFKWQHLKWNMAQPILFNCCMTKGFAWQLNRTKMISSLIDCSETDHNIDQWWSIWFNLYICHVQMRPMLFRFFLRIKLILSLLNWNTQYRLDIQHSTLPRIVRPRHTKLVFHVWFICNEFKLRIECVYFALQSDHYVNGQMRILFWKNSSENYVWPPTTLTTYTTLQTTYQKYNEQEKKGTHENNLKWIVNLNRRHSRTKNWTGVSGVYCIYGLRFELTI